MSVDDLICEALSGRGAQRIPPEVLEGLIDPLRERGFYISSMEAFEQSGEWWRTDLDRSMLGLNGEDHWPEEGFVDGMVDLARSKIASAKASGSEFIFTVWLMDI